MSTLSVTDAYGAVQSIITPNPYGIQPAASSRSVVLAADAPLPAGANVIGSVSISGTPSVAQSGSWNVGLTGSLPAFAATPTVNIGTLPALPAGANTIGSVNVLGGNATAVKVDGSAVTQPVSSTQLPSSLGAKTSSACMGVVVATDQILTTYLAYLANQTLAANTSLDVRPYGSVDVQVNAISGGDSIAFTASLDNANFVGGNSCPILDLAGNSYAAITAPGRYTVPGRGFIQWAKTGSASSPTVYVTAHQ